MVGVFVALVCCVGNADGNAHDLFITYLFFILLNVDLNANFFNLQLDVFLIFFFYNR